MKNTDIAAIEKPGLRLMASPDLRATLAAELDKLSLPIERIKIPIGGSTVFEFPGESRSETEPVKEFSAVILHHHPLYAYYATEYTGGSNPPDCASHDGVTGKGTPGGDCAACPYNQFGSGKNDAKACKNRRRIFVLRENDIFPMYLSLPTGSLREFTRYLMRLLAGGKKSSAVVTRFSLTKAFSRGGVLFTQAQFAVDRCLTAGEYEVVSDLGEQLRAASARLGFDGDESDETPDFDPETDEVTGPLQ